jgi:uncharacterized lipoprotein YddW (UPF0748 family)
MIEEFSSLQNLLASFISCCKRKWRFERLFFILALACFNCSNCVFAQSKTVDDSLPHPPREFRAVWVATVNNIDFPSNPNLTVEEQKQELTRILDAARDLHLNAIIFQVRPQCDAIYASAIEPWSEYLTGAMGKPPEPFYDPLEFLISEAHARALELHAWFNPYRALHPTAKRPPAPTHISVKRPDLAKVYGQSVWLDPGERDVQDYSLRVVLDVVRRYDIDGVHFDDYFYPYKEKDASGRAIPFPDEASWNKYRAAGGKLNRDDWRRQNVDRFIQRVSQEIKRIKPHVKFGISPFGIWQPGYPPSIKGFNAYAEIYADSRKWLRAGWVDYLTPQLYWKIADAPHSYTALLDWWNGENVKHRYIFPGNSVSRIGSSPDFSAHEILDQIIETRKRPQPAGNIFFSMKTFLQNRQGINELLKTKVYQQAALVPALTWISHKAPAPPRAAIERNAPGELEIKLDVSRAKDARWWIVYARANSVWDWTILPTTMPSFTIKTSNSSDASMPDVAVSIVDRFGNESRRVFLKP